MKKIIGNTVGMGLPKPNLMQTDPTKGDYVKGKEKFLEQAQGGGVDLSGYATKEWVKEDYQPKGDYLTEVPDGYAKKDEIPVVPQWAMQPQKPTYNATEVGADQSGTAESKVSAHNVSTDAHNDIRVLLLELSKRVNAIADSDDTTLDQMSEIVAYIKSNKSLIEAVTTEKVSYADIIDNLATNLHNKPLSAAQGVALKALIDAITVPTKVSELDNDKGYLTEHQNLDAYALKTEIPTVPKNVSAFTNDAGYLTQHQDISGKLDADKLPQAIDTALAQAKASGEFDGKDGKPGKDGSPGADGYTPQKGVDYWTDADVQAMVAEAVTEVMKVIAPSNVNFSDGRFFAPATNVLYKPTTVLDTGITFQYKGGGGVEELYFPITGLYPGRTYTIVFDETYNGGYIQDTYRYGCGIIQKADYDSMAKPTTQAKPSWVAWHTGSTGKQSGSITFVANADTVYWAWSLGRLSDGKEVTISMNARVF